MGGGKIIMVKARTGQKAQRPSVPSQEEARFILTKLQCRSMNSFDFNEGKNPEKVVSSERVAQLEGRIQRSLQENAKFRDADREPLVAGRLYNK